MKNIDSNIFLPESNNYIIEFDCCVFRKTLFLELINASMPFIGKYRKIYTEKINYYQSKWRLSRNTYDDYLNFTSELFLDIYKKFPKQVISSIKNYSEKINEHQYNFFKLIQKSHCKIYFLSRLPEKIVYELIKKKIKASIIKTNDEIINLVDPIFIISSTIFLNDINHINKRTILFNPSKNVLNSANLRERVYTIVIERKDVVYYNLSAEKFF